MRSSMKRLLSSKDGLSTATAAPLSPPTVRRSSLSACTLS